MNTFRVHSGKLRRNYQNVHIEFVAKQAFEDAQNLRFILKLLNPQRIE